MQEINEITTDTILVTGATGHLGTAVVRQLLKKVPVHQVVAFARNEQKAAALKEAGVSLRLGNFDDLDSLKRAMEGVDTVLLISGTDAERGIQQHENVVNAAHSEGVRCVAYTGRSLKDRAHLENELMRRHFETEDYIRESGLPYIFFRNSLYMDTLPFLLGQQVFERGIFVPSGQGRVAYALRSEQGEAIANVLATPGEFNKTYQFTGSEAWSFADVAATLSDLSGKLVGYTPAEKSVFEAQLKEQGVPDSVVQSIAVFMSDIGNGQEEEVAPDLEIWLGRKPASLRAGLKTLFNL